MKTATQKQSYNAKAMKASQKKDLALEAMQKAKPITDIAQENDVSRKFIYVQKNKAVNAVNDAFDPSPDKQDKEKVLFYIAVTPTWIRQFILSLILLCHGSYRGVQKTCAALLDYHVSIGTIHNVVHDAVTKATEINKAQDLSAIKNAAPDEIFHHNKPVLVGVDIPSLYCYLLANEESRDGVTWGVHLLDLQEQGLNPDRFISDDGTGLRAGHKMVFENTPCDGDCFHMIKELIEVRRFFRNRLKSAITYLENLEKKMGKTKNTGGKTQKYARLLGLARQHKAQMLELSESIDILVSWMQHDVLKKAGSNPQVRGELYDFIVDEFKKLAAIYSHRIEKLTTRLKNQKPLLLAFAGVLNEKFQMISEQFNYPVEQIWKICELQRCQHSSDTYAIRSLPLQDYFHNDFDLLEDAVMHALDSTESTSCMVENLNSRLSPYFFLRREIGFGYLDLLQFFLNHTSFLRSSNPNRAGKTPTEILTGKPHKHWLELLGLPRFKRAA